MLHKGTLYHFMKASRLVHTVFRVAMASLHLVVHEVPRSGEFIVGRIWMHAVIALSLNMTDVLVSIKTTKKRLKALFVNESSTNLGTDLNSVQTPREVNVAIGGDEEDYYVDFNDRCSLVRLSLGQSDKSHEDSRQSDGDSSSRAAGYTERGSLSIKESKRKSGQSNKSSSLIEVLLDPVREESVCIDDV